MPRVKRTSVRTRAKKVDPQVVNDIRAINAIRKDLGKRPLPVRNSKWYTDIVKYSKQKYGGNQELSIKMIGASLTPYMATKLNNTKGRTISMINKVVNKQGMYNHTLDEAIRAQNVSWFESLQFEEMNHVQEAMLSSGQLDIRQSSNKIVETKLHGLRPK